MVRNSRLIFFHVVSLAVPGSPALLWQGQGQSAPGTGEFPVPCRGARGCRGADPSPLCRQAGRRPVSMVSIRRLAEPPPRDLITSSHTHFASKTISAVVLRQKPTKISFGHAHCHRAPTLCVSASWAASSLLGQCWAMQLPASSTVLSRGTWQSFRKATGQALMESEDKFLYQSS